MKSEIQRLKDAFENKKVVLVESCEEPESIARFTMEDKSAYILYATDLGFWIDPVVGKNGKLPKKKKRS